VTASEGRGTNNSVHRLTKVAVHDRLLFVEIVRGALAMTAPMGGGPQNPKPPLFERDPTLLADDEVVEDIDIEELPPSTIWAGDATSSGEGVGSPLGWLAPRSGRQASSRTASRNTSAIRT